MKSRRSFFEEREKQEKKDEEHSPFFLAQGMGQTSHIWQKKLPKHSAKSPQTGLAL